MSDDSRAMRELNDTFDDLESLLKNNDVGSELSGRGVNIALALTAVAGLRAYIRGDKIAALEDLGTAVEEIASRASVRELRERTVSERDREAILSRRARLVALSLAGVGLSLAGSRPQAQAAPGAATATATAASAPTAAASAPGASPAGSAAPGSAAPGSADPAASAEDKALARDLLRRAMDEQNNGSYAQAIELLEHAAHVYPHPFILLRLATAWELAGQHGQALAIYERILALDGLKPPTQQEASSRVEQLRHRMAQVQISVTPPSATLLVDDSPATPGKLYLRPGPHELVARTEQGVTKKRITVLAGETVAVALEVEARSIPLVCLSPAPPPPSVHGGGCGCGQPGAN